MHGRGIIRYSILRIPTHVYYDLLCLNDDISQLREIDQVHYYPIHIMNIIITQMVINTHTLSTVGEEGLKLRSVVWCNGGDSFLLLFLYPFLVRGGLL